MAVFSTKPILLFEENQYSNFQWIGEADDGCLLCRWEEESLIDEFPVLGSSQPADNKNSCSTSLAFVTQIAVVSHDLSNAQVLYTFDKILPVVQATVNATRSLIGFVVRGETKEGDYKYSAFISEISPQGNMFSLNIDCSRQILLEFLQSDVPKKSTGKSFIAKLLVFIHRKSISTYSFSLTDKEDHWVIEDQPLMENVVQSFVWAQWEHTHHHLYYLHYRPPPEASLSLGVDGFGEDDASPRPMLTALQFHSNKQHETVLNVPLELAGLEHFPLDLGAAGEYRDQGLLHMLGDPWLDLQVLISSSGAVCICHHYLYKSRLAETPADSESCSVFLAYSVTLLHHGCVLHSVIPGVLWGRAKSALPTYTLLSDHYLLVIVPGICVHMLDIGLEHLPTNHIVGTTSSDQLLPNSQLYQLHGPKMTSRNISFVDVSNELRIEVRVTKESLFNLFKTTDSVATKVAIFHMAAVHDRDHDLTRKLMWNVCENSQSLETCTLLQEYLVGETFAAVSKHMDTDAAHLLSLIPVTTSPFITDTPYIETDTKNVRFSYCMLENAVIMLLSPRERLIRDQSDPWTKLWNHTIDTKHERFPLSQVVDKLMVSLDTYKPEALSRGMTPVSPASPLVGGLTIASLGLTLAHLMFDPLPFNEAENSTSSKLEHLLSVNLRELSMYCLKQFPHESPMRVHAVASKYVCTQLQVSRRLCSIVCASQTLIPDCKSEKGFTFIYHLNESVAWRLFNLIERYHLASDAVAFPLPQGYNSFFAFLAYKCLDHHVFMQYVHRGVLQLNVDVLREIMYDLDDDADNVERKLEIASSVPLVRCLRALQYWSHPDSLITRARLHSTSILAGEGSSHHRKIQTNCASAARKNDRGSTSAFPTRDKISPFDTFIDLLTAKAKLSDLDLCLLHDGTLASIDIESKNV